VAPAPTSAPEPAAVRFGGLGGAIDAPLFIGQEKGYFAEQGLEVDALDFASGLDQATALATGHLDASHGGMNAAFLNAMGTGIGVKIVSGVVVMRESSGGFRNNNWVVVRSSLADEVRSVADLKGRKFGSSSGGPSHLSDKVLRYHGLTSDDVQWEVVSFADMPAALANGAVDVVLGVEPGVTIMEDRGIGIPIFDTAIATVGVNAQHLFYGQRFIEERPDAARRFMVGYVKAMRYIEAVWTRGVNREEAVALYVKHTPLKDPKLYDRMGHVRYEVNADTRMASLEDEQALYLRLGLQRQRVDLSTIVDRRFAEHAVQVLGRVPE
jgi:NitT/TauT family transport system substrate-binding protein